jgi:two-component system, NtrC family, sensor kinase
MRTDPYVVFVDDNTDDAVIACWRLSKAGVEVESVVVALEQTLVAELGQRSPDLIVSDFSMPGFDGWDAFRVAQSIAPRVPFIFHSGSIGEECCRMALARGAYGCVEKDNTPVLVQLVKQALRISK